MEWAIAGCRLPAEILAANPSAQPGGSPTAPPAQTAHSAQCCAGRVVGGARAGSEAPDAPHSTSGAARLGGAAADTAVGSNPSISSATIASQTAMR
jgi:hypothetical protein